MKFQYLFRYFKLQIQLIPGYNFKQIPFIYFFVSASARECLS